MNQAGLLFWLLVFGVVNPMIPSAMCQKQVTAQEVQAFPAKFNGQRVFVYAQMVQFPASHVDRERGFSEFMVITAEDGSRGGGGGFPGDERRPKRDGGDFSGHIIVRVPAGEVERFSETHAIKAGQGTRGMRKKITAIFRACHSGQGGYLDMTDGSSANVDPLPPGGDHPHPKRKSRGTKSVDGDPVPEPDEKP